jgi:hypothetical protein
VTVTAVHPRIKEVHDYLVSAHLHLREALDPIPPDARDTVPAEGQWSVAQVLEHLATVNRRIAALFRKRVAEARAAGIGPDPETTTILWTMDVARVMDRQQRLEAPETVRPKGELDAAAAWAALVDADGVLRDAVIAADGVDLSRISHPNATFGPLNFYQWGAFAAAHEMRHAAQIRDISAKLART